MRKLKHKKQKQYKKKDRTLIKSLLFAKNRWITKRKTFSPYPYIITISFHKRNIFFTLSNIRGQIKIWTSAGRLKFTGWDKTAFMAIIQMSDSFVKRIWRLGIRRVILKLKNAKKRRLRFAIWKGIRSIRRKYPIKFIGVFIQRQIAFNGCRKKKQRRK